MTARDIPIAANRAREMLTGAPPTAAAVDARPPAGDLTPDAFRAEWERQRARRDAPEGVPQPRRKRP